MWQFNRIYLVRYCPIAHCGWHMRIFFVNKICLSHAHASDATKVFLRRVGIIFDMQFSCQVFGMVLAGGRVGVPELVSMTHYTLRKPRAIFELQWTKNTLF